MIPALLASALLTSPPVIPSELTRAVAGLQVSDFESAKTDLNGDGRPEWLIYAQGEDWCGSGGCTLFVLTKRGRAFRVVSRTTISRPPIWRLTSKSHGWHDLAVWASGGGIARAHLSRLRFDGRRYPGNPSVPPAMPVSHPIGKLLIAH